MKEDGNPIGSTFAEPRAIIQSLGTKFNASADVAALQRINQAIDRIQSQRAQKLAASRDTLHRSHPLIPLLFY